MLVKKSLGIVLNPTEKPHGELYLKSESGEWLTHSSAVLIGSHLSCDYKIFGRDVKPFHALIYFSPEGAFVEGFTHGCPGIIANGLKTMGATKVEEDFVIEIDITPIHLKVYGDLHVRCDFLFEDLETKPGLAISQLNAVESSMFELPQTNEAITIGSPEQCNIQVDDETVSDIHADLYFQ
ncbi:MAG: FHA domain-containing protein [Lentisphaerales bacterium]|nr:FHA domain-containing protein [Lentisphaerales bacterium]